MFLLEKPFSLSNPICATWLNPVGAPIMLLSIPPFFFFLDGEEEVGLDEEGAEEEEEEENLEAYL